MGRSALVSVAAVAAVLAAAQAAHAVPFAITISVDENGNGSNSHTDGFHIPLRSGLENDPGPGGQSNVLTYGLTDPPFILTAGDVLINEPGGYLGDVVRFNPTEGCFLATGCLLFYSNPVGGAFDSLADIASPPSTFYTDTVTLVEGLDGAVMYTPIAGQPGFVIGAGGPVTYDIMSDVPEPASLTLIASALIGFGAVRRRKGASGSGTKGGTRTRTGLARS